MYAEFSELFGSGLIIDGDRIRGKTGTCTIKSRKEEGDSLKLSAACASSVMTQDPRFRLKIIDDNNISPSFPAFGDEPELHEMQALSEPLLSERVLDWSRSAPQGEAMDPDRQTNFR